MSARPELLGPVAELRKNSLDSLRVTWCEFKGRTYLDVRQFFEDGGERKPTKRGVTVPPALLAELIAALQAAQMRAREAGVLP